ncbi:ABC transporter ATP-binding protein, partial [Staphylococcus felis]
MLFSVKALEKQKAGRQILSDVTWEVNEGERWLVYGLNGAGKS